NGRREADLVVAVVEPEGDVADAEHRVGELRPEAQRVEAVRDRGAERRLLRALGIHVDELVVVGRLGERVDVRLRDLVPVADAAAYRVELHDGYHADRPPMPAELAWQWDQAPTFFGAFGWSVLSAGDLEADDLLGSLAQAEVAGGGSALLFTGDRDMFQCVSDDVAVLFPKSGSKDGPEYVDVAGVRERYG